jgi:hypothetical protein
MYVVLKRGLEGARGIRALKHTVLHVQYLYYKLQVLYSGLVGEGEYEVEAEEYYNII